MAFGFNRMIASGTWSDLDLTFRIIVMSCLSTPWSASHTKAGCTGVARCNRNKATGTYLLTPWSRVHLEQLIGIHLVKKFPTVYGNRRFITVSTSARHLSLP